MPGIDLHSHTTASDGSLAPRELVRRAAAAGVKALAVTDHDTVEGLPEALEAGREFGLEIIPGIELSVESPYGWMHILGLWLRPDAEHIGEVFSFIQESRRTRNRAIIEKLRELDIDITLDEVSAEAGGQVGRPHFSKVLFKKGLVQTPGEAFQRYLGAGGMAYVPKAKLTAAQALSVLHEDGALSVLAHPYLMGLEPAHLEQEVARLRGLGLDGIEVYYTEHDYDTTLRMARIADRLGLLESGGSDFHGDIKPLVRLGIGKGDLFVPPALLERMKDYRRERGLWV